MSAHIDFRKRALRALTNQIGVYALCDLDKVPIYVGKSVKGIRSRVRRHLTSARSDIIANRQIDVWEIAYVWAYPVKAKSELDLLEAALFHRSDADSKLMNGATPQKPTSAVAIPKPAQIVQVISDEDIAERRDPSQRLPRQAGHYAQIVGHFLAVKNSNQIAQAMDAHFERLSRYHQMMRGLGSAED